MGRGDPGGGHQPHARSRLWHRCKCPPAPRHGRPHSCLQEEESITGVPKPRGTPKAIMSPPSSLTPSLHSSRCALSPPPAPTTSTDLAPQLQVIFALLTFRALRPRDAVTVTAGGTAWWRRSKTAPQPCAPRACRQKARIGLRLGIFGAKSCCFLVFSFMLPESLKFCLPFPFPSAPAYSKSSLRYVTANYCCKSLLEKSALHIIPKRQPKQNPSWPPHNTTRNPPKKTHGTNTPCKETQLATSGKIQDHASPISACFTPKAIPRGGFWGQDTPYPVRPLLR